MLMTISKEIEGGFDGKIRFPSLEEEFIKGKLDKKIFKVDVGPLLLAIGAKNTKAVSLILQTDKLTNLLESLKGPKETYMKEKENQFWNYKFTFPTENNREIGLPFYNLGMAMLADCE